MDIHPLQGRWEILLAVTGYNPKLSMPWNFHKDGCVWCSGESIGSWTALEGNHCALKIPTLRLFGLPADFILTLTGKEFVGYAQGQEQFVGRWCRNQDPSADKIGQQASQRNGFSITSVFPQENAPPPPKPRIEPSWVGLWVSRGGTCTKRVFREGLAVEETTVPVPQPMELRADGSCRYGMNLIMSWIRTSDGRLLLNQGCQDESFFQIVESDAGMTRVGPFRENGERVIQDTEFLFLETLMPAPPVAPPKPSPWPVVGSGYTGGDWREDKQEEWRKTGRWSGCIGGAFTTSYKDPDDWEHPYNK